MQAFIARQLHTLQALATLKPYHPGSIHYPTDRWVQVRSQCAHFLQANNTGKQIHSLTKKTR